MYSYCGLNKAREGGRGRTNGSGRRSCLVAQWSSLMRRRQKELSSLSPRVAPELDLHSPSIAPSRSSVTDHCRTFHASIFFHQHLLFSSMLHRRFVLPLLPIDRGNVASSTANEADLAGVRHRDAYQTLTPWPALESPRPSTAFGNTPPSTPSNPLWPVCFDKGSASQSFCMRAGFAEPCAQ